MDKLGKYISHVKYVDFTLDFSKVLNHSCHQVVPKSETGTFDEHGIFPMNVIRVGDKILGYTNGWSRRQSVDVETGIGFLVSNNDGQTFERPGLGPILSSTINEPFLVGDPFVISVPGGFRMWYIFGQKWNIYENNRLVIKPSELDFYLEKYNIAIELNGNYFHSEVSKTSAAMRPSRTFNQILETLV
jgi:hypothetical protein